MLNVMIDAKINKSRKQLQLCLILRSHRAQCARKYISHHKVSVWILLFNKKENVQHIRSCNYWHEIRLPFNVVHFNGIFTNSNSTCCIYISNIHIFSNVNATFYNYLLRVLWYFSYFRDSCLAFHRGTYVFIVCPFPAS